MCLIVCAAATLSLAVYLQKRDAAVARPLATVSDAEDGLVEEQQTEGVAAGKQAVI